MSSPGVLSIHALSQTCTRIHLETAGSSFLKAHCILRFADLLLEALVGAMPSV